jgi:hypothetical protein
MSIRLKKILYLSVGLVCLPGLAMAQASSLKHDPFARPVLAPRPTSTTPESESEWKPELRAVLVAGPKSIVNIEGALLRHGDQFNGYRLVEVHEESAVFVNNNKRVTLTLRGIEPLRPQARQKDRLIAQQADDLRKPEDK